MRIWFDTEFYEDGQSIDLISIGMVREDGATYYAEEFDAPDTASRSDWLVENVLPHLGNPETGRSLSKIRREILEFAGESPEFWAYYADYDWIVLCQLFGTMVELPSSWPMYCRDLRQAVDLAGAGEPPRQESGVHNALEDALWVKSSWEWLRDRTGGGAGLLVPAEYRVGA